MDIPDNIDDILDTPEGKELIEWLDDELAWVVVCPRCETEIQDIACMDGEDWMNIVDKVKFYAAYREGNNG